MKKSVLIPVIGVMTVACTTTTPPPDSQSTEAEAVPPAAESSTNKPDKPVVPTPEIEEKHDEASGTELNNYIQTGRYTVIAPVPLPEQSQLLDVVISVTLPEEEVYTVGQGIRYLLKRSGYQLVNANQLSADVLLLFSRPIPRVHRHLGPMTLRQALNTLATPAFRLVEDPVHRFISFTLKETIAQE